ncbi:hypothetical protein [Clostridium sp.]|uniref:hypothetical protein n=1 Tax=Clostridium sp. TaxID=1506 RepID=UPI0026389F5A|nr:hypothetical protein [Clostridium sp.]
MCIIINNKVDYKYQIGNIITDVKFGKLKILEQIRINSNSKARPNKTTKGYKYECLNCGNIDTISEYNLSHHQGCNVCCKPTNKVLVGYNDMWTINPDLASLLANPDNGYKYTQNSNVKVDWECPNCGNIIENKTIHNVNRYGISCPRCSDGISYPEKFMCSVLEQLKIDFKNQLSKKDFNWCDKYKYDFYFKLNNKEYIIEMDGEWHNKDNNLNGQTKEESKEIDNYKNELADEHNIEVIRIDCDYGHINNRLKYIKNNIINNVIINKLFNLNIVDWNKCHEFACCSLVKIVCDLWNSKKYNTTKDISNIIHLNKKTINEYLKLGVILNWSDYNPKEERIKNGRIYGKINGKKSKRGKNKKQ